MTNFSRNFPKRNYPVSKYAKFSDKLIFLTPWYVLQVRVLIRGEMIAMVINCNSYDKSQNIENAHLKMTEAVKKYRK